MGDGTLFSWWFKGSGQAGGQNINAVTKQLLIYVTGLGSTINGIQYNRQHNSLDSRSNSGSSPFFIKPNLKLDSKLSFDRYDDRVDCRVILRNEEPHGRFKWLRLKGRAEAINCEATLTVEADGKNPRKYHLIWLLVDSNLTWNPSKVNLNIGEHRPLTLFVINLKDKSITIPTFPTETLGIWKGDILPHGEYRIRVRVTSKGVLPCDQEYGKWKLPEQALKQVGI